MKGKVEKIDPLPEKSSTYCTNCRARAPPAPCVSHSETNAHPRRAAERSMILIAGRYSGDVFNVISVFENAVL